MLKNEASSSLCITALLIEEDPSISLRMTKRGDLCLFIRPSFLVKTKKGHLHTQMAF